MQISFARPSNGSNFPSKSKENIRMERLWPLKPIKIASEIKEKQSKIYVKINIFSLPSIFIFPNEERRIHENEAFVGRAFHVSRRIDIYN